MAGQMYWFAFSSGYILRAYYLQWGPGSGPGTEHILFLFQLRNKTSAQGVHFI